MVLAAQCQCVVSRCVVWRIVKLRRVAVRCVGFVVSKSCVGLCLVAVRFVEVWNG